MANKKRVPCGPGVRPSVSHPQTVEHLKACPPCLQDALERHVTIPGGKVAELAQQVAQDHPRPRTEEPTNEERAGWAMDAVQIFARKTGLDIRPGFDGLEVAVQDLLTDIMHLCDAYAVEFLEVLGAAGRRYQEEVQP